MEAKLDELVRGTPTALLSALIDMPDFQVKHIEDLIQACRKAHGVAFCDIDDVELREGWQVALQHTGLQFGQEELVDDFLNGY